MFLVRDIMYCKPGKVRALVEKFRALNKAGQPLGLPSARIMTDLCAERYWTVVTEVDVASLDQHGEMIRKAMENADLRAIMEGYHDMVESGRREIYTLEK